MNIRERFGTLCSRLGVEFLCPYCSSNIIIKSGRSSTGKQRYRCKHCRKRFITDHTYKAYLPNTDFKITQLTKEGLGIRSTARILGISVTTLLKRILQIASNIKQPPISVGKIYEVDEMRIFIGKKSCPRWLVYALDRETRKVVAFNVGRRTNRTLSVVLQSLFLSKAKMIYTDKLKKYSYLMEKPHSLDPVWQSILDPVKPFIFDPLNTLAGWVILFCPYLVIFFDFIFLRLSPVSSI